MNLIYYEYNGEDKKYIFKIHDDNGVDPDPNSKSWVAEIDSNPPNSPVPGNDFTLILSKCIHLKLTATYIDGNGVQQTAIYEQDIIINVNIEISYILDITDPKKVDFTADVNGLANDLEYIWLADGVSIGNTSTLTHTFSTTGVKAIKLIVNCDFNSSPKIYHTNINVTIPSTNCDDPYDIYLYKKGCHDYVFKNTLNLKREFLLTDYKGVEIERRVISSNDTLIPFETPSDGVYIITITSLDIVLDPVKVPLYDTCDIDNCYYQIVSKIQCVEGKEECSEAELRHEESLRKILNSISGLIYFIDKYIKFDVNTNRGVVNISEDRRLEIGRIEKMMELIKKLLVDCGYCDFNDSECVNC